MPDDNPKQYCHDNPLYQKNIYKDCIVFGVVLMGVGRVEVVNFHDTNLFTLSSARKNQIVN